MTSSDFLLCYASVTTSLFDQIEHDMQSLASAHIDDDDAFAASPHDFSQPCMLQAADIPLT